MNSIIVFLLAIIAHEFGHWIIPQCKGLNPKLIIGLLVVAVSFDNKGSTPIQMLIDTRSLGIMFGLVPIVVLGNAVDLSFLLIIYLLFSSVDIFDILSMKIKARRNHAYFWYEISS